MKATFFKFKEECMPCHKSIAVGYERHHHINLNRNMPKSKNQGSEVKKKVALVQVAPNVLFQWSVGNTLCRM